MISGMSQAYYGKIVNRITQMKIIHRSIFKELVLTFLLSLASLNFIIMMEKLIKLSRLLSGVGTSFIDMVTDHSFASASVIPSYNPHGAAFIDSPCIWPVEHGQ